MQEYCYRGTRKDATKAILKLIVNNLTFIQRKRALKRAKKRYLPNDTSKMTNGYGKENLAHKGHDEVDNKSADFSSAEQLRNINSLSEKKSRHADKGFETDNDSDEGSSGFDSAPGAASCNGDEVKIDNEVDATTIVRQDGQHLFIGQHLDEGHQQIFHKQKELDSIIVHLEEQNAEMRNKLKHLEDKKKNSNSNNVTFSQPLDSCHAIQEQLDKLKQLMDNSFKVQQLDNVSDEKKSQVANKAKNQLNQLRKSIYLEMHSINEPGQQMMIESTPVVKQNENNVNINTAVATTSTKKQLTLMALDKNFSPIIFRQPAAPKTDILVPSMDLSTVVDELLEDKVDNNEVNGNDEIQDELPSLSAVSMGDLTSLLAKTGHVMHMQQQSANGNADLNITESLELANENGTENFGEDIMEEMENLMIKLENVFQSFRDPALVTKTQKSSSTANLRRSGSSVLSIGGAQKCSKNAGHDAVIVGQIVSEISDQLDAFASHLHRDNNIAAQPTVISTHWKA